MRLVRRGREGGAPAILCAGVSLVLAGCPGGAGETTSQPTEPTAEAAPEASVEATPAAPPEVTAPAPTTAAEPTREELEAEPSIPMIAKLPDPAGIPDSPKGRLNGEFAPDLKHVDMRTGQGFDLSRWTGPEATEPPQAVVVGFTASWCGPCRQSYPFLQQLQEEHGDALKVVLVTTDAAVEDKEKHVELVDASGLQAPLLDPSPDSMRAWLGQRRNVPHFFVLNRAGEVLVQDRGFGKKVKKMLPGQVRYALNHPEYVVRSR